MKGMNFKQEYNLDAPLLLERKTIEELDSIIEKNYIRAVEELGHQYEEAVESEYRKYYSDREDWGEEKVLEKKEELRKNLSYRFRASKSVSAKLSKEKYFNATTIKDLISAPELTQETIKELKISFGVGDVRMDMLLQPTKWRCLSLGTLPENNTTAREVFIDVRDWAHRYKAPLWQKWWSAIKGYHWNILTITLLVLLGISKSPQETAVDIHNEHAHQILEQGVSSQNQSEAIELILRITSEYVPDEGVPESESNLVGVLILILVILIVLSFLPTLIIGIGKGEGKIKFWKGWLRILSVGLPGLILTTILWPILVDVIKNIIL